MKALKDGVVEPGYYTVSWDGRDRYGRLLGTGVYFVRLEAGEERSTIKLVLLR